MAFSVQTFDGSQGGLVFKHLSSDPANVGMVDRHSCIFTLIHLKLIENNINSVKNSPKTAELLQRRQNYNRTMYIHIYGQGDVSSSFQVANPTPLRIRYSCVVAISEKGHIPNRERAT